MSIVNVILGIKVSKTSEGLILLHSHYIKKYNAFDGHMLKNLVDVNYTWEIIVVNSYHN